MDSNLRASYAFVTVLLSVVTIIGAVNLAQPSSPITATQSPIQPCALSLTYPTTSQTTFSNGTEITQVATPAFIMSPGSTMDLCVNYSSLFNNTYTGQAYNSAYRWESGGQLQPAQGVASTASPADISIAKGQSTYVKYAITAGQNSTGFYGLSMLELCIPTPLAVGYGPSQVNSTDFPGIFGVYHCPLIVLQARVVGHTGANVTYLKFESRYNPPSTFLACVSSFPTSEGGENVTFRMSI